MENELLISLQLSTCYNCYLLIQKKEKDPKSKREQRENHSSSDWIMKDENKSSTEHQIVV